MFNNRLRFLPILLAILSLSGIVSHTKLWAASCCGGGSASALVMPKFSSAMLDISLDVEQYDGFWDRQGKWRSDPPDSGLRQFRLNTGAAYRLGDNWQTAMSLPYVWNDNHYSGIDSQTQGVGDTKWSLWYETFENVTCVWKIYSLADLKPALYYGLTLTLPTGISPFDQVNDSFDVTGRGFYRLEGNILLEKTIYPWNMSLLLTYGKSLKRPVNREYGEYVTPYDKQPGDSFLGSLSFGYTYFMDSLDSLTFTLAQASLQEKQGHIDQQTDPTSGFRKNSRSLTVAFANVMRAWSTRLSWNHTLKQDHEGFNFPSTDILSWGMSYVFW
ncbi:MAG: hypothetical protein HQM11_08975 [SAR324 cluster bacterium]|nr:hypothetical protein [SAR324 cluster bacterium]